MLTTAQKALLKSAVLSETEPTIVSALSSEDFPFIRDYYNEVPPSPFVAWRVSTPTEEIHNAIVWKKLTPADTPDITTVFTNRALICIGRQLNLIRLLANTEVPTGKDQVRQGIKDALTAVPSGASGTEQAAGWTAVKGVIIRDCTRGEALLASGEGTTATPGDLTFEGELTFLDIIDAVTN